MGKIQKAIAGIFNDRKELGKTNQARLAKDVGCSKSLLNSLLLGDRRLNEDWIEKICVALDVSLSELGQIADGMPVEKTASGKEPPRPEHTAYHKMLDIILQSRLPDAEIFRQGVLSSITTVSATLSGTVAETPREVDKLRSAS